MKRRMSSVVRMNMIKQSRIDIGEANLDRNTEIELAGHKKLFVTWQQGSRLWLNINFSCLSKCLEHYWPN